jgi:hypothetical protein
MYDFEDPKDPNFPFTGRALVWKSDVGTNFAKLYAPTEEAKKWDGAPAYALAVGSRYSQFSYVQVAVTGRKVTLIPGTGGYAGAYGLKCKVTFAVGTEDESVAEAWILAETSLLKKGEVLSTLPGQKK